ncbi:uncharacterized protein E0L32_006999 [Thyridium curvatum]|uniref:Uncharacterized protein n=1 Tax=Thyridium curvatum TaxID=1093900 RepID=A0A507AQT9_9PEZI|nr:uncharacterized protein E0L32_006999 [Thyridium curvatum]TPX12352.1 hypothetical protein E0L32_006999 [Thyridium curvatum]
MGYPSAGCRTCKKRRVKAGRDCDWDQGTETGLQFRSENAFAQGQARRPRRGKGGTQQQHIMQTPDQPQPNRPQPVVVVGHDGHDRDRGIPYAHSRTELPAWRWRPRVPPGGEDDGKPPLEQPRELTGLLAAPFMMVLHRAPSQACPVELQAFNFWARNFVYRLDELPDMGHEYTTYVLPRWDGAPQGSVLDLALSAVTHAVFGRARRAPDATAEAVRLYQRCVVAANEQVRAAQVDPVMLDDLLMASMLMAYYENTMFSFQSDRPHATRQDKVGSRFWKNFAHHQGAAVLLKLRREKGMRANLALDKVVRRQIVRTCILRGVPVPAWMADGKEYGEEGPVLALDSLMVRLSLLRARSVDRFGDSGLSKLGDDAQELDRAFAAWASSLPPEWTEGFTVDPTKSSSAIVPTYASPGHAAVWNRYRAARIAINSMRLASLPSLTLDFNGASYPIGDSEHAECRVNIEVMTRDICGGMQYFLDYESRVNGTAGSREDGDGDGASAGEDFSELPPKLALFMAWPLTLAISTKDTPPTERLWLAQCLQRTARALGDSTLESILEQKDFKF